MFRRLRRDLCYNANQSRTCTVDTYRSLGGGFGLRSAIRRDRPRVSVDEQRNPGNNVCRSFRRVNERNGGRHFRTAPDTVDISPQISAWNRASGEKRGTIMYPQPYDTSRRSKSLLNFFSLANNSKHVCKIYSFVRFQQQLEIFLL